MFKVLPVILCGGSGTRLWPLSRANFPKQFLTLSSENCLFQEAIERINSITDISIEIRNFIIVTSEYCRYMVEDDIERLEDIYGRVDLERSSS
jgi:mannose-1-phosphate guanylyltransferase/mannose-6-phosphate isomerase